MHLTKATIFLSSITLSVALKGTTLNNNIGLLSSHQGLNIHARQETVDCEEIQPPFTNGCERSCGEGYEACGSFPKCYNPDKGEKCCDDNTRCPAGMACSSNGCIKEDGPTTGGGGLPTATSTGMLTPTSSDDGPSMPTPTMDDGDDNDDDNDSDNGSDETDGPDFTAPSFSISIDLPMPTDAGNRLDGAGLAMGGGLAVAAAMFL